ncbi:MAG: GNAT family N-acetyltransferase [Acidimicrobiales bacterium]|nr:GNAT family N-acetyltransferase [Acidimicrobiales bacterium]
MSFASRGIDPPPGFAGDGFVVRPLLPSDVELDYAAVMASREFLYHWEQDPPYPAEDFSLEDNLADLEQMAAEHSVGSRYTYTVMNADETETLGCVYVLANDDRMYQTATVTSHDGTDLSSVDATVVFWVRPSTWADGFERTLLEALLEWFGSDWSLERPVFVTNESLDHQIATIESLGLVRRFDYDRAKDMYTSHAYA